MVMLFSSQAVKKLQTCNMHYILLKFQCISLGQGFLLLLAHYLNLFDGSIMRYYRFMVTHGLHHVLDWWTLLLIAMEKILNHG